MLRGTPAVLNRSQFNMHSQVDCLVQFGNLLIQPENKNPKNDTEFKVQINADNFTEIFSSSLKPSEMISINKSFDFKDEPFDINIILVEKSKKFWKNIYQIRS
jgi:hypothetical protein